MLLDGPDLFHLTQEVPGRPTHTLKIAVLDAAIEPETVRTWLVGSVRRMPVLRRTVARGWLRPARWIDAYPDVGDHCFDEVLGRGGEQTLREHLAALAALPLEGNRPLWALHHLRDPSGPRSILVFRIHHALADGAASVRLWEQLADGGVPPRADEDLGGRVPGRVSTALSSIAAVPDLVRRWRRHGRRLALARSAGRHPAVEPFTGPPTPFNHQLTGPRACTFCDLDLDRTEHVGATIGVRVNDVLLAVTGGALRRLLEDDGHDLGASLTATVPAALPERQDEFGNAVTTLYLSLHSDLDDPVARARAIAVDMRSAREVLDFDPRLLPDSQRRWRAYRALVAAMHFEERRRKRPAYNAIVSSVRGPSPLRILGCDVTELRSIGPLTGRLGLNITAWSYRDRLFVGVHAFRDAVADLDRLGPLLQRELDALAAAVTADRSSA